MFKTKKEEPTKIFINFETQTNNDIRIWVNNYMSDPDIRACLSRYSIDLGDIATLQDGLVSEITLTKYLKDTNKSGNYLVIAHNGTGFDVTIWNKIFPDCQIDWNKTLDTSWLCRVLNVPASLENATKFFGISEKF